MKTPWIAIVIIQFTIILAVGLIFYHLVGSKLKDLRKLFADQKRLQKRQYKHLSEVQRRVKRMESEVRTKLGNLTDMAAATVPLLETMPVLETMLREETMQRHEYAAVALARLDAFESELQSRLTYVNASLEVASAARASAYQTLLHLEKMTAQTVTESVLARQTLNTVAGDKKYRLWIIANTLPKVGSTSVVTTLQQSVPGALVEQLHALSEAGQRLLATAIERNTCDFTKKIQMLHLHRMMEVRQALDSGNVRGPTRFRPQFICGTREPISWALSLLFQMHDLGEISREDVTVKASRETIIAWMGGTPPCPFHVRPEEWFEREIQGYLGIDLSQLGFNTDRGYQVYQTPRAALLIIRQENLDCMVDALSEFLVMPKELFEDKSCNITSDKPAGELYEEVKEVLKFPVQFLEELYSRPYAVTFYSEKERKEFIDKWKE